MWREDDYNSVECYSDDAEMEAYDDLIDRKMTEYDRYPEDEEIGKYCIMEYRRYDVCYYAKEVEAWERTGRRFPGPYDWKRPNATLVPAYIFHVRSETYKFPEDFFRERWERTAAPQYTTPCQPSYVEESPTTYATSSSSLPAYYPSQFVAESIDVPYSSRFERLRSPSLPPLSARPSPPLLQPPPVSPPLGFPPLPPSFAVEMEKWLRDATMAIADLSSRAAAPVTEDLPVLLPPPQGE